MKGPSRTPALAFLIFARPATTARVWQAIRRARPARLMVVADGARSGRPDEARRVAEARALIKPDWPCAVRRLYADANLGCGRRISGGLDWVFRQAPEAVILEDDCVPHPDFFRWCAAMLAAHRNDPRVMGVAGSVPAGLEAPRPHLSRYQSFWGWATWRRAWRLNDFKMAGWPEESRGPLLRTALGSRAAESHWRENFWEAHWGRLDTWGYPWMLSCWRHRGLCLVPPLNLVTNVGVEFATHPTPGNRNLGLKRLGLPARALAQGASALEDPGWDDRYERLHFSGAEARPWKRPLKRRLRPLLRLLGRM